MQLPRGLVRAIGFPAFERLRGRSTVRQALAMRMRERWDRAQFEAYCDERLVALLRHAVANVPHYRALGLRPEAPADLLRFPLLDKPGVRAAGRSLIADGYERSMRTLETGGSSGQPLRFFTDLERESSQLAGKVRARAWWGLHSGHREADLWGSPIETGRQGFFRRNVGELLGFQLLSAFALNESTMGSFRRRLARGRADFLYGYPSVLARYARFLEARGETGADLGLRLVITTAEVQLPADRDVIGRVFGCPVTNEYGCRDGGLIAHGCPDGSLHLLDDAVFVEVIDDRGTRVAADVEGEVVLTNLWAWGAPMIRYRLGDRMTLASEPCSCGLPLRVAQGIAGRQTDSLVRTDGTRVHGLALIYVLREFPGVDRFRCVQSQVGQVVIEVVPTAAFDAKAVDRGIVDRVRRVLGSSTEVEVRTVTDIPPSPSGKFRFIVCDVPEGPLSAVVRPLG